MLEKRENRLKLNSHVSCFNSLLCDDGLFDCGAGEQLPGSSILCVLYMCGLPPVQYILHKFTPVNAVEKYI